MLFFSVGVFEGVLLCSGVSVTQNFHYSYDGVSFLVSFGSCDGFGVSVEGDKNPFVVEGLHVLLDPYGDGVAY